MPLLKQYVAPYGMSEQVRKLKPSDIVGFLLQLRLPAGKAPLKELRIMMKVPAVPDVLIGILQSPVLGSSSAFSHHITLAIQVIEPEAIPLQQKVHCQVVGMTGANVLQK